MENRKVALVTGSSRGIGRACALALAKAGYDIAVHHSVSPEAAEKTCQDIKALGMNACILQGDTGDADVPQRIVNETVEKLGRLDVLVNNAGLTIFENLMDITVESMDRLYNVDFRGMILCASAAARYMVKSNIKGNIVFNTSIRSYQPHSGDGVYGGLKAGLNRIIKSFAIDMGPYGIRVNGFSPGVTNVRVPDPEDEQRDPFYHHTHRYIPLRKNGYAEDMGGVVAFLVSDAASYITGQVIPVDGGLSAVGAPECYGDLVDYYEIEEWMNPPPGVKFSFDDLKKTKK